MVACGSRSLFAGIRLTQSGDPLTHGEEGVLHCASSDRLPGGASEDAAAAVTEDEHEAEAGFKALDVTQGGIFAVFLAEDGPILEDATLAVSGLGNSSGVCGLQRRAEVSSKAISGRRVCCVQEGGRGKRWERWERNNMSESFCRRDESSAMTLAGPGM
jgi:hypothetical protein